MKAWPPVKKTLYTWNGSTEIRMENKPNQPKKRLKNGHFLSNLS
jgi:hypothetical protein